jgi:hypothetical protein
MAITTSKPTKVSNSKLIGKSMRGILLVLALTLSITSSARAQHPATQASCFFAASCTFSTNPGPNQIMIAFGVQSTGSGTATVNDVTTYNLTWTQFSAGYSTGTSNVSTAWWAKTGSHSGTETVTVTWSGGGTNQLINLVSFPSTDADITATGGEDYSGFHANANNTCASTLSISYTLSTSSGSVMENEVVDTSRFSPNSGSSTGPTVNAPGGTAFYVNSNSSQTTFLPITAGSYTNTFGWSTCSGGTAIPFMYIAALKGPSSAQAKKMRINNI